MQSHLDTPSLSTKLTHPIGHLKKVNVDTFTHISKNIVINRGNAISGAKNTNGASLTLPKKYFGI
jgi:hypothetical protein